MNQRDRQHALTVILCVDALHALAECSCNDIAGACLLHFWAQCHSETKACYDALKDPCQAMAIQWFRFSRFKPKDVRQPTQHKWREVVECTVNVQSLSQGLRKMITCPCGHIHAMHPMLDRMQQDVHDSRKSMNQAVKAAAGDTMRQNAILNWTMLMWSSTYRLLQNITMPFLTSISDSKAQALVAEELASSAPPPKEPREQQPHHSHHDDITTMFLCPLTKVCYTQTCSCQSLIITILHRLMQAIIEDPVIAADGHTYERHAMVNWLTTSKKSPVTGQKLRNDRVVDNVIVRSMLHRLRQEID